jgi:pyruvate/2-oxoglutarate dehydrogenase complex dihydrolipoamide dehydrogenase (E3) component
MNRYNLVVIGAGAAGLTVAGGAALLGARVALLEQARMGGDCLNYGCVPSKALLHVARVAHTIRNASAHAVTGVGPLPRQDLKTAMDYVRAARARLAPHDSSERFTAMGVHVIPSPGRLRSRHEVEVLATGDVLWGRHIVVATGSRPRIPEIPGLREAGFLTNETVFDCQRLPEALLVIGGGPIGAELGQGFARLGSTVTIVTDGEHILPREDADVADVLARRLRAEGITIWERSTAVRVERRNGRRRVAIRTPADDRSIDADEILVCVGRQPTVEGLGLETAGVAFDERGIKVSRSCRTNVPSVWAVGDVTDTFKFTHWGGHQARMVVRNALFPGSRADDRETLAWTTFTEPEVARMGYSEREARARGLAYDVFTVPFAEIDRAVCDHETEGYVKVLTRRGRGKILGAAIVHARAGELIGQLTLAKRHGISLTKLAEMIHVYPTLSDVHRAVADQYLLGRLDRLQPVLARVFAWLRR